MTRGALRSFIALAFVAALTACHKTRQPSVQPTIPRLEPVVALRRDIDAILSAPELGTGYWGVVIRSLTTDETIYSLNAGKLMMPASNMKLVTLAAAADRLGWDYTFETRLVALGTIDGGMLNGDLLVVGSGDPSLDDWDGTATRLFESWADQLKAKGINGITGRVIGDDRAFSDDGLGFGWSWDDLGASFAAPVSALQFNEGAVQVVVTPATSVGQPATLTVQPDSSGLNVRNLIRTDDAGTGVSIERRRLPGNMGIELRGSVPAGGRPVQQNVAVDNPTLFFVSALKSTLVARGVDVQGPAVDVDEIPAAPSLDGAVPLVSYRSPPLSVLAGTLMKLSQNQFAEAFLRALGASAGTPTARGGSDVVRQVLQSWGVAPSGLLQVDGSGLSRYNYVSPENLVGILAHIARDERLRTTFEAALPMAGSEGTLTGRLRNTPADGRVRAKDGAMNSVRAFSGYLTTAEGEQMVFSVMGNNFDVPAATIVGATDAILIRLTEFRRSP